MMKKSKFNPVKGLVAIVAVGSLLGGCGGSSGGSSSGGGGNPPSPLTVSNVVVIDAMTSVPVINGSATKGTLYLHNYGDKPASGFSFGVDNEATSSKLMHLLAKVGLTSSRAIVSSNGFTLTNPERCASIPAGGSCQVNFTTPGLDAGNRGNSLVTLNYQQDGKSQTTNQVVNYSYVSLDASSGVNFTGSIEVSGQQGEVRHVVGYLYGGGSVGRTYQNVRLNPSSLNASISGGFVNPQEVAAGQVIAVEYAVALQGNNSSYINVTPTWGDVTVKSAMKSSLTADEASGSGTPLSMNVTAGQSVINLLFGNVPILSAESSGARTPESIGVTNNGNTASPAGLTATSSSTDLQITNNCSGVVLNANAANSCTISFVVKAGVYTPGNATVTFKNSSNVTVGTQQVYWTNSTPVPVVYIDPNPATLSFGKGGNSSTISFTVTNIGRAPLDSASFASSISGPATWQANSSGACKSAGNTVTQLLPGGSCTIQGTLNGADDGTGKLYYTASGGFNNINYSFRSLPVNYTVSAAPSLTISPNTGVSMTLLANNESTVTQVFTVTNTGNDPALFSAIDFTTESKTSVKPIVITDGGAQAPVCSISTTLVESGICYVTVKYGPAATSYTANESGIANLTVAYHGGTPDTPRSATTTFNYNLVGNDSTVQVSAPAVVGLTGSGTSASPYLGYASATPMTITLTYTNPSVNYNLSYFNLNTNNLPYGVTVNSGSTCKTGDVTGTLAMGASCTLILKVDRDLLEDSPQGGSSVLNITEPVASWSTPLGFYRSQGISIIYLTYLQPTISFTLSNNNSKFESTILTMTAVNESAITTLTAKVSGVKNWLESSPVSPSANCTIESSDYSVSCNLKSTTTGTVTYLMPTDLNAAESMTIPLLFNVGGSEYAYLSPAYTFINLKGQ